MPSRREAEKGQRLAEAQAIIEGREDGALVGRLLADIARRGQAEDIIAYTPAELAALVEDAWKALALRPPGQPRIRIFNPDFGEAGTRHQAVTIIEVLNDDMPFLLDSVMGELTESGLTVHLVLHPILAIERDGRGALVAYRGLAAARGAGAEARESFIHIHVGRIGSEAERVALGLRLEDALGDVRAAVADWRQMLAKLGAAIETYRRDPPPVSVDEGAEAIQFLQWLGDDNFTFLGMRDYVLEGAGDDAKLVRSEAEGLGVLRDPSRRVLRRGGELLTSTPEIRDALLAPRPLVITKANIKSRVHRHVHMDYVGIKRYADGRLVGELRVLGLFTSTAYTRSTRTIPYVRRKAEHIVERAGFDPLSHSGKSLFNVLESLPRDELLQIEEDTLFDWAMQVLALDEHPRVRVLVREDIFRRHVSVLVYVPRDRYSTDARLKIGGELEKAFNGRVAAYFPAFPEGALARVHFIIARPDAAVALPVQEELEAAVTAVVRSWADGLEEALLATMEPTRAELARDRYGRAFSPAYQDHFTPEGAIPDIRAIERLTADRPLTIDFQRREHDAETRVTLKLFHQDRPIPLSERIPVLENMGFRVINERTYRIEPTGGHLLYMHEMALERADGAPIDLALLDAGLEALFLAVWTGAAENDGFNALGLKAGLAWRDIAILRAMARYLRQIRIAYSQDYIWTTLINHAEVATLLVNLFRARFDPDAVQADRKAATDAVTASIAAHLDQVTSLDEDRILRRFVNLIESCVRTNAFQIEEDGEPRRVLAFKLDSRRVDGMPEPKPFREIWIYAPRVEGVHLRFGKVARGGLRWSDRPQDFRTEVLGLVKAQQVKNAVIVPVGAKGGFVPKWLRPGMSRDEWFAEGTEAYKTFVRTLLTVTDNLDREALVPPPRVVRHEGDDPYLVVAADKGTATFSDTANGLAIEAGYWLGDAFASGGSAGYDHKKMGITARGAFEAVKRHFREMDVDIMTTPFSVVGVGDMSGDVFGNGMLLAPTIRLLAAFDHRDIFIDPTPDPATSLAERRRLFEKPRSSWQDYDRAVISPGGGVFSRALKSIELSPEARSALGITADRATPQEVMRAILKADADLLWFGGIGTYIRADEESDAEVGDKANDGLRIAADELRVKVIGEGANLGVTQKARIAFAARGGRCNSDAIDNSAGVNSSDVEVNIKIALAHAMRAGKLDLPARNALLASMTEEVAGLVLANNYSQTLAISMTERRGMEDFGYQRRLMQSLEARSLLDRAVEDLPDDAALAVREKAGRPLTRPELGVLLAYAKLALKDELLASAAPDDPVLGAELFAYFPSAMRSVYADAIAAHRLRRDIVTTRLVNAMIDRGGPTLVVRATDQTGAPAPDIALAFAAARDIYAIAALDDEIDALDTRMPGAAQLALYGAVQDLLLGAIVWLVRNVALGDGLAPIVMRFRDAAAAIVPKLPDLLPADLAAPARAEAEGLVAKGVPEALAHRMAYLAYESEVPDIVLVAERSGTSLDGAARVYFDVAHRFRIRRLEEKARGIAVADYFDGLALDRARGVLADAHRRIAADAMSNGGIEGWVQDHGRAVDRTLATVAEITASDALSVSRLAVAAGLLADLARAA